MNRKILIPIAILAVAAVGVAAWQLQAPGSGGGTRPSAQAPAPKKTSLPAFDVVRVEPSGTAVIAGRALPGAKVNILDGDKLLGTATADARGDWTFLPPDPLAPGARELRLEQVGSDGAVTKGLSSVVLAVPERDRDLAGRRGEGDALAVLSGSDGSRVLQAPRALSQGAAPRPAGEITIDTVDYDRGGKVSVGGQAKPGTEVMLYLQNNLAGRAKVGTDGRWSITPDRIFDDGQYSLRVDQVGPDSKVISRAEVNFDKKPIPDQALAGRAVVVVPGNNLWAIARRSYGEGIRYTVIFEANQGQIRDPDLIYPGQIFLVPEGK
ncbi:LysM peptidoglycan-binding domain-containing protein [Niveispirillum sp.]|uniref:LysM peptidoglycan-binding domain-containing protein n=1 Tax=Niveispirillum sp. TaxID=1917217 RepID=UPI001B6CB5BB|nr:LysM peptidoglycan-binding domain-containing protein [Niveispirillum sp.]MBP7337770.1 LysM peptidoglycan-binding domain-containing protein [Niveispirillum sp.]